MLTAETLVAVGALLFVGVGCGARTLLDATSGGAEATIDAGTSDTDVVDADHPGPDTGRVGSARERHAGKRAEKREGAARSPPIFILAATVQPGRNRERR